MGKFRRSSKIYRYFWLEDINAKLFGTLIVYNSGNSERKKFVLSPLKRIRSTIVAVALLVVCCLNIYDLMRKKKLTLFDSVGIPSTILIFALIINVWFDLPKIKEQYSNAVDLLQVIDDILTKYYPYSNVTRSMDRVVDFLTVATVVLTFDQILFIILFFTTSYTKSFMLFGIISGNCISLPLYLAIIRILLKDRLRMFKIIMNTMVLKPNFRNNCHWCNRNIRPNIMFCEKHKIM